MDTKPEPNPSPSASSPAKSKLDYLSRDAFNWPEIEDTFGPGNPEFEENLRLADERVARDRAAQKQQNPRP